MDWPSSISSRGVSDVRPRRPTPTSCSPGEIPLTPEATERLTALSEFQDLGSGMRIAMRDLEIRGAGSLVGAEQHGNLSSVGFDLFTQMLGQAVAEARGEVGNDVEESGVTINLPADFFLDEEYLPAVDRRVLVYRKLAAAEDLAQVDEAQEELKQSAGPLPRAAQNLFDRARIRIRGGRLGLESVVLTGGRLVFQGIDVPKKVAFELRDRLGAVNFPKTRKISIPYKAGAGGGSGVGRGLDARDERGPRGGGAHGARAAGRLGRRRLGRRARASGAARARLPRAL